MNQYLQNLKKIEFVITYACTGKCKHCSEGDHRACGERIDPEKAADAVRRIASAYPIRTVMTFGGEPLLYPEAVYAVQTAARDMEIEKRQVITNGWFSKDPARIAAVAEGLAACGVNDVLLSADAFHQETIPIEPVKLFASELKKRGVLIRHFSSDRIAQYNRITVGTKEQMDVFLAKTKEIIKELGKI